MWKAHENQMKSEKEMKSEKHIKNTPQKWKEPDKWKAHENCMLFMKSIWFLKYHLQGIVTLCFLNSNLCELCMNMDLCYTDLMYYPDIIYIYLPNELWSRLTYFYIKE